MSFLIGTLLTVLVIVCVLLVAAILMQPSKADSGIGSAFGGQATDALFGANTPTFLAKFTAYLTAIFFALSFLLAILIARQAHEKSLGEKMLEKSPAAPTKTEPSKTTDTEPAKTPVATPSSAPQTPAPALPVPEPKKTETPPSP